MVKTRTLIFADLDSRQQCLINRSLTRLETFGHCDYFNGVPRYGFPSLEQRSKILRSGFKVARTEKNKMASFGIFCPKNLLDKSQF